jgi:hypothetical protein
MAGEMQSSVIVGGLDSLEEIQVEFVPGDRTRQLRGANLDFTAVGSDDGYRRSRARLHMHLEVDALPLVLAQISKSLVIRVRAPGNHEPRSSCGPALIMPGSP